MLQFTVDGTMVHSSTMQSTIHSSSQPSSNHRLKYLIYDFDLQPWGQGHKIFLISSLRLLYGAIVRKINQAVKIYHKKLNLDFARLTLWSRSQNVFYVVLFIVFTGCKIGQAGQNLSQVKIFHLWIWPLTLGHGHKICFFNLLFIVITWYHFS